MGPCGSLRVPAGPAADVLGELPGSPRPREPAAAAAGPGHDGDMGSINAGTPVAGWFIIENLYFFLVDDYPPFWKNLKMENGLLTFGWICDDVYPREDVEDLAGLGN